MMLTVRHLIEQLMGLPGNTPIVVGSDHGPLIATSLSHEVDRVNRHDEVIPPHILIDNNNESYYEFMEDMKVLAQQAEKSDDQKTFRKFLEEIKGLPSDESVIDMHIENVSGVKQGTLSYSSDKYDSAKSILDNMHILSINHLNGIVKVDFMEEQHECK
jgi:hypothetical protein